MSAQAITELTLESGTYAVLQELLASKFDGAAHDVGGNEAVAFPKAVLAFGQSSPAQPLNKTGSTDAKVSISAVLSKSQRSARRWDTVAGQRVLMCYTSTRIQFWIRADGGAGDGKNAQSLCLKASDYLAGLLGNPTATRTVKQKGIHHLRPSPSEPVAETTYILRTVSCQVTLRYPVKL